MKCMIVAIAILVASLPSFAANPAHYTLYYLDQTHNVIRISLDNSGKPIGKPERLTQDMVVDDFSVSPGEKTIIGLKKTVSQKKSESGTMLIDADVFLWKSGKTSKWSKSKNVTEFQRIVWTKSGKYVAFVDFDPFGNTWYTVFATADGNFIANGDISDLSISPDERFIIYPVSMESHMGSVLKDLRTGAEVTFFQPVQWLVWIGNSGKAAWVYDNDKILVGRPTYTNSKLELRTHTTLLTGVPSDLYYMEKKGLYFTLHKSNIDVLYLSKNLKTYTKIGVILPKKKQSAMQVLSKTYKTIDAHSVEYSPDRKFIVYSIRPKGTQQEEIRIVGAKGDSLLLDYGTAPHWKSPVNLWNSNGTNPCGN